MSMTPSDLENPERDLDVTTRDTKGAKKVLSGIQPVTVGSPMAEEQLTALRERIAAALATTPKDAIPHCGDCYRRGWKAALQSLE